MVTTTVLYDTAKRPRAAKWIPWHPWTHRLKMNTLQRFRSKGVKKYISNQLYNTYHKYYDNIQLLLTTEQFLETHRFLPVKLNFLFFEC